MSKYYSPRDWDVIGFGGSRRYVRISDEEIRKRAAKKTDKQNKKQKHKMKHGTEDFWETWERENENK